MGNSSSNEKAANFFKGISKGVTSGVANIGKAVLDPLTMGGAGPVLDATASGLNSLYKCGGKVHTYKMGGRLDIPIIDPEGYKNILLAKKGMKVRRVRHYYQK